MHWSISLDKFDCHRLTCLSCFQFALIDNATKNCTFPFLHGNLFGTYIVKNYMYSEIWYVEQISEKRHDAHHATRKCKKSTKII